MYRIIEKWGLTTHVRKGTNKSKIELILFLLTKSLKQWREDLLVLLGNLESNYNEVVKLGIKKVNFENTYKNVSKIAKVLLDNEWSNLEFTTQFIYLSYNINFLINNTNDIRYRTAKANNAIGTLKFV